MRPFALVNMRIVLEFHDSSVSKNDKQRHMHSQDATYHVDITIDAEAGLDGDLRTDAYEEVQQENSDENHGHLSCGHV